MNNGTENEVRTFQFDEEIVYPENPTKEGYTFSGWSPKPVTMPAENVTVTAQWIEIKSSELEKPSSSSHEPEEPSESSSSSSSSEKPSEYVEILFGKKDLKKEEIREIIKRYTDEEFTIELFEDEKLEGTRVIVKFVDKKTAQSFIDEVKVSSSTKSIIGKIGFIHDKANSFSFSLCPLYLFGTILYF